MPQTSALTSPSIPASPASARVRLTVRLLGLLVLAALTLLALGCTADETPGDGQATATGADGGQADGDAGDPSQGALAAAEFVLAAIDGRSASSYFASDALGDDQQGATFDVGVLTDRLVDLETLGADVQEIRASTSAYPDAAPELGPACDRSTGLYCQVDLYNSSDSLLASVVVFWFGDGVTDYSIIRRTSSGAAVGIGEAGCSSGLGLLHGGHTDRFDIAICADETGALEYSGAERGTENSIRLDACQDASDRWVADNLGFRYVVDGTGSSVRSQLDVFNPSGTSIENGPFTAVRIADAATPTSC